MSLNLLDRRPHLRDHIFELDCTNTANNTSTSSSGASSSTTSITEGYNTTTDEDYKPTDITSYYRKKLYYLIRRLCFREKLPHFAIKLLYETCIIAGKLVEVDTNRVKVGNISDLQRIDSNLLYNIYGKNHDYEIFISCGTFFMGVLSHVSMNLDFDHPKIALIKQLTCISEHGLYRNFVGLKKDEKILETLVESLQKSHIQIIFTSSAAPIFLSNLLVRANITCIAHIPPCELYRLAQVTKSTLYASLVDACEDSIQDQLGKLLILGEKRHKLIIASECDFHMGLSVFTNALLIPILEKSLSITFRLFSEELFIKSINGSILPSLSTESPETGTNPFDSNEFGRNDLTLDFFSTRKLKLCGRQSYTFTDNTNADLTMSLKTWIKDLLLNCTKFDCPFDNSCCNGHLSEHTLFFSNRKYNIEMSFIYNYKLLALPDSNFSTYIQRCCYNCGDVTPSRIFNSNITLLNFIKTLLNYDYFTHKCKNKSNLTTAILNNQYKIDDNLNHLFLGNSKEVIFSLISDDSKLTFPFKISFKLLPFEKYQFIPLVSNHLQMNGNLPISNLPISNLRTSNLPVMGNFTSPGHSTNDDLPIYGDYQMSCQISWPNSTETPEESHRQAYVGGNIYLYYFQIYSESSKTRAGQVEFPPVDLVYSLHLHIINHISPKKFKLNFLENFPCRCDLLGIEPGKPALHHPTDSSILDDWILESGLGENLHEYIKEVRDKNLVFRCNSFIQKPKFSKCEKPHTKSFDINCINRDHCTNCTWQCFSSWQSLYIYNLMLLVYSLSHEFQIDSTHFIECMCELYITHIILSEFTLPWNEIKFLANLSLAKFISYAKNKIPETKSNNNQETLLDSPIGHLLIGNTCNINKSYNILNGLIIDQFFGGVNAIAESHLPTSRADLASILAKNFTQTSFSSKIFSSKIFSSKIFSSKIFSSKNQIPLYSAKTRVQRHMPYRRSIFCTNSNIFRCDIFHYTRFYETPICYGNKKFIIENFFIHQFAQLRSLYGITHSQFIKSICKLERKHSTGGKSGAPLYVSHDRKYVVKLLNTHELECFVQNGLKFIKYFTNNRNTLLCTPFACMKINILSPKTIFLNKTLKCIILQNVDLCNEFCNHNYGEKFSFDLKGVGLHRSNVENISSNYISGESTPSLNDSQSVLGLFDSMSLDKTTKFLVDSVKTINPNSWPNDINSRNNLEYDLHDVVLWDRNFFEYTKGCPLDLEDELPNLISQIDQDTKLLSELNVVDYSLLLHIYPKSGVLCLSIIDYLRPYTWDKQVETIGKKLANITSGETPTILSPMEYMRRFREQVETLFSSGKYQTNAKLKLHFDKVLASQVDIPTATSASPGTPEISTDAIQGDDFVPPLYNRIFFMNRETANHYHEFVLK